MAEVNPAEISAILKKQLSKHESSISLDEIGSVLNVGDGIARVYGLFNAQYGELVEFSTGTQGIVLNLEEDNVGIVMLGSSTEIKEGDTVKRTSRIASVKVGSTDCHIHHQFCSTRVAAASKNATQQKSIRYTY